MDQVKIGSFIAECRKRKNLTQAQLAEKLNLTDRAISKWETGRSMPDSSVMLELCEILEITVNELLNGEAIEMDQKEEQKEKALLDLVKQKQVSDKKMLALEMVIGVFSVIILFAFVLPAALLEMKTWIRITLIVVGLIITIFGITVALKIEQEAGYYQCAKCGHKYVPSFSSVFWAMHVNRTRYMKCPACGKKSWNKKVVEKE